MSSLGSPEPCEDADMNKVETIDKDLSKAKHETESYAKSAKAETLKKIDEVDRKVEEKAAATKGYLSSWFGGK